MIVVSVISSVSAAGSMPLSRSASRTWSTNSSVSSWRAETFTDIPIAWPFSRQPAPWRQASRRTQLPISAIIPVSSSNGTKSSGCTPRARAVPAQQRLHARGGHVLRGRRSAGRRGRTRSFCSASRKSISSSMRLCNCIVHRRLKHHVPVLAIPLGAVHRHVRVAQQLLSGGRADPSQSPRSRSPPGAGRGRRRGGRAALATPSKRSAISSGPAARDIPSAITTNSSPPRRPSASVFADRVPQASRPPPSAAGRQRRGQACR